MHIRLNHTNATMLMVSIVVALLFVLNYSAAQWTQAPANPPSNNVAAPINVGNAEQTKAGILGVGGLGVNGNSVFSGSYIDYSFVRTGGNGNEPSKWRIRRNDGTTNWASYLNTDGGSSPTLYASGNAFRQAYMPGSGIYSFEVSNTSGPAGATFSWNPAMRINPDGSVNIRQLNTNNICDANGNNCGGGNGSDGAPGSDGTIATVVDSCYICTGWVSTGDERYHMDPPQAGNYSCKKFNDGWATARFNDKQGEGDYIMTQVMCGEDNDAYYWHLGQWSSVPPTCPIGENTCTYTSTRTVECRQIPNNNVVADSNCPSPKPNTTQTHTRYNHDR